MLCRGGKPELTTAPRSNRIVAVVIPEGFSRVPIAGLLAMGDEPGGAAPEGARAPGPARLPFSQ